ncbi:MAG: hypothetical protein R2911_40830 [Caldilineaceae bacterium]
MNSWPQDPRPASPSRERSQDSLPSRGGPGRGECAAQDISLLHLSRRLDWRFLLPDSTLGQVGYLGQVDAQLVQALAQFAENVAAVSRGDGVSKQYDLVVAGRPNYAELAQAVSLVRPGGYLYVETSGLLWVKNFTNIKGLQKVFTRWRLWSPQAHVRVLTGLGMHNVTAYWCWPNFAACTRMTPLDDPAAYRFLFATMPSHKRLKRRAIYAAQKAVVTNRWLNALLPSVAIVAAK